jgi:hypothetical protein
MPFSTAGEEEKLQDVSRVLKKKKTAPEPFWFGGGSVPL